jgi:hypothetical protein
MDKKSKNDVISTILFHLALTGEKNKWQICSELKLRYSTVHKTIPLLLKGQLIKVTRISPSKKNAKVDVEYYEPTFLGILTAMYKRTEQLIQNVNKLEEIIRRWSQVHPLFSKWEHLSRYIPKNELVAAILASAAQCVTSMQYDSQLKLEDLFMEAFWTPILTTYALSVQDKGPWVAAALTDKELKDYIVKNIGEQHKFVEQYFQYQRQLLKELSEQSETNIENKTTNPSIMFFADFSMLRRIYLNGVYAIQKEPEKVDANVIRKK